MQKLEWNSFIKKIYIKATSRTLYHLWATEEGITSWFLRKATYQNPDGKIRNPTELIQKGDTYTWQWHNWDGSESGKVLEANDRNYIEISFESSKVSIELEEREGITLVILKQFNIPLDEESKLNIHHSCSNGWTFWLANLKAFVEHGILLNETEIDLRNQELAGFQFVNM